ncbi:MAG: phage holin family protein [Deltaproteobacteria bacterium]
MKNIFGDLGRLLVQYIDLKARQYATEAFDETRTIVQGVAFFAASAIFWTIGLVFVFLAVFFWLSPTMKDLAVPALITAGISIVIAAVVTYSGVRVLNKRSFPGRRRYAEQETGGRLPL